MCFLLRKKIMNNFNLHGGDFMECACLCSYKYCGYLQNISRFTQENFRQKIKMIQAKIIEKTFDFRYSLEEQNYTDMLVIHHTGFNDIDASTN